MAKKQDRYLTKIGNIWHFRKIWRGKRLKRSLQTTDRSVARELRDQYLNNLVKYDQLDPPNEAEEPIEKITFGQAAKVWASVHKKEVKYSTWRDYVSIMNSHVLPVFKDRPIDEISYLEVLQFRNFLNVGAKRANNIMVPMRSVFDLADKQGWIDRNVMKKLKRMSEEEADIYPFSLQEISAIVEAMDPWYRPYTETAFFTGMRSGEINALRWDDYHPDMANGPHLLIKRTYVYGQDGAPKTKKSKRSVLCLPEVVNALLTQWTFTGQFSHIFLTRDHQRMTPDHFREVVWVPALKKAKIEYRPPIQTRHTFATMMLSANEDIGWVQNMLGHASLQMIFQRYYAWMPQKTRRDGQGFRNFIKGSQGQDDKKNVGEAEVPRDSNEKCTKIVPLDVYRQKRKTAG